MNTQIAPRTPWTTIRAFATPIEAHLAATALENEGIACFVRDEHSVGMRPHLSFALGGVRLDVPADEAARALQILGVPAPVPSARSCPRCGGEAAAVARDPVRGLSAVLATLLASVPFPLLGTRYRCTGCGHEWRRR